MRGCLFIREFLLAERLWLKSDFRYNFILSRIRIECWQVVVFRQSSLAGVESTNARASPANERNAPGVFTPDAFGTRHFISDFVGG